MELDRVGAAERRARARCAMLDLAGPDLDFVALAQGMGVPATAPTTRPSFAAALERPSPSPARTSSRRWSHRSSDPPAGPGSRLCCYRPGP